MKIHSFLQIGDYHQNHCEDFLLSYSISEEKHLLAVMDGCSSGTDSFFASSLFAKILKKCCIELAYLEFSSRKNFSLKAFQKEVLKMLFEELKYLKNKLHLQREELLSTLILAVISPKGAGEIVAIGDGLICCDGEFFEYEQDDRPDYLAYHLATDFSTWFENHSQFLSFSDFKDLSIATDGIFTFKHFDTKTYPLFGENEVVDFLLRKELNPMAETGFRKKISELENGFGLRPADDLAVFRVIF